MPARRIKARTGSGGDTKTAAIAAFFASRRRQAGVTETAAAAYLECPIEVLRAYESGEKALPMSSIYALANFLNVEPSEISAILAR